MAKKDSAKKAVKKTAKAQKAKTVKAQKTKAAKPEASAPKKSKNVPGVDANYENPEGGLLDNPNTTEPAPKKTRGKGKKAKRGKKDYGGFAWYVREQDEFGELKDDAEPPKLSGPFNTEQAALEDISAVAPEGEVVLMRGYRIGRVKTVTKLVG